MPSHCHPVLANVGGCKFCKGKHMRMKSDGSDSDFVLSFPQQPRCQTGTMPAGKLIFSQFTEWIHPERFRRCVARYHGNRKVYNFPCWDQFLAMTFAQLTYRVILAD